MSAEARGPSGRSPRFLAFVPLAAFVALAAVFMLQLLSGRDVSSIPSALIGQPAPVTKLPPLDGISMPGIDSAQFDGKVTVLNVWASWCLPCREEQPVLMALAEDKRFGLVGLNHKDRPDNARNFLLGYGNPFSAIGVDESGRSGIEWGVYGVPETFVVGKDGKIAFKHVGPLSAEQARSELLPQIEKALAAD